MTNSSTVEGEHTIHGENEDEDDQTLANIQEVNLDQQQQQQQQQQQRPHSPDIVETYSASLRHDEDDIQLLRLKLEEVHLILLRSHFWQISSEVGVPNFSTD
jgi:hypothetical protein